MKKAAISFSFGTVMTIVILLIFAGAIIVIFFLPESLLPEIAEKTKGFERFLPGKFKENIPAGMDAPEETKKIFDGLYDALVSSKGKEDCYITYTSLDIGEYTIELEYIESENGVHMRLVNEEGQLASNYLVSGVQPCIALPSNNYKDDIADERPLTKAYIKDNNEIEFWGEEYDMFENYPILYKPKDKNLACFFTNDYVTDPSGKKYGNTAGGDGFDWNDMKERMNTGPKCS